MHLEELVQHIHQKQSFLCIGLDTDIEKMPEHIAKAEDPIFTFNKAIIDATHHYAVAYKPNLAFYEAHGLQGWEALQKTIAYLRANYPDLFTIADAKRGDIGNTATRYARAFFEDMQFDAVTVAPYMGRDSVEPFLEFPDKHTIMLALTSNPGAFDFQTQPSGETQLYKKVLEVSKSWKNSKNLMYVVGATKAEYFAEIRRIVPDSFLLVPGVGAQGGSLQEVCSHGMNAQVGLLVNSSRGILYASNGMNFADKAAEEAKKLQKEMALLLQKSSIVKK